MALDEKTLRQAAEDLKTNPALSTTAGEWTANLWRRWIMGEIADANKKATKRFNEGGVNIGPAVGTILAEAAALLIRDLIIREVDNSITEDEPIQTTVYRVMLNREKKKPPTIEVSMTQTQRVTETNVDSTKTPLPA